MFCSNCGTQLKENARFCESCGCAVANSQAPENFTSKTESNNPYANVASPAPVQNAYNQPQNIYYASQNSYEPTYQPQQNFPNTPAQPPQYLRPVQTPTGVQYIPVEPVVSVKKPESKYNPFVFISAGITGVMILLLFMPWIMVGDGGYNIITMLTESSFLERFDAGGFAACSIFMFIGLGMLLPAFILALVKKNQMPIGFSVAASVLTFVSLFFFIVFIDIATSAVSATIVPVLIFFLAVASLIFPSIARKVGR